MKKIIKYLFICCAIIGLYCSVNVKETFAEDKMKILFISSYSPDFITFDDQLKGIKSVFNDNAELQIDYMNYNRFITEGVRDDFHRMLKYKLSIYNDFDAILLGDDEATKFAIRYSDELFKNIPVVYFGVQEEQTAIQAKAKGFCGIREKISYQDNIDLIKKLHPNLSKIVLLTTNETREINKINEIKKNNSDTNIEVLQTDQMSYSDLKDYLGGLNKNDIIFSAIPGYYINNQHVTHVEFKKYLEQNIKTPYYSSIILGNEKGTIGGKVISHFNQGKQAAEVVERKLTGKNLDDVFIDDDSSNQYVFNYGQLNQFKINENLLPQESEIKDKPLNFIEKYGEIILPLALIMVSLIATIIVLFVFRLKGRKYEKKLLEAKKAAEDANMAKSNFISNINHELRTPVSVIMSANQLLTYKVNEGEILDADYYNKKSTVINQNCFRLLRLINNIIDISKADSEFNELMLKTVNVVELIENTVSSVVSYVEQKNIDIIFDTSEEEIEMTLDPYKVERIVLNLISNAIKFTEENGEINVFVDKTEENLIFYVEDNGVGMDDESLNNIFEKFTQVDNSLQRRNEGSGIGLSIVKTFTEMHNGKVTVESTLGKGSKFTVIMPIIVLDEYKVVDGAEENNSINSTKIELSDLYL